MLHGKEGALLHHVGVFAFLKMETPTPGGWECCPEKRSVKFASSVVCENGFLSNCEIGSLFFLIVIQAPP